MRIKTILSAGEIVDKATILEIKAGRINDPEKVINVLKELKELSPALNKVLSADKGIKVLKTQLFKINCRLWDTENSIRKLEAAKNFGKKFIELARSIYINNDKRALTKNKINILSGSSVKEEKEYYKYK